MLARAGVDLRPDEERLTAAALAARRARIATMARGVGVATVMFGIGLPTALMAAVFGLEWSWLAGLWLAWQILPFVLVLGALLTRRIAPNYAGLAGVVAAVGLVVSMD